MCYFATLLPLKLYSNLDQEKFSTAEKGSLIFSLFSIFLVNLWDFRRFSSLLQPRCLLAIRYWPFTQIQVMSSWILGFVLFPRLSNWSPSNRFGADLNTGVSNCSFNATGYVGKRMRMIKYSRMSFWLPSGPCPSRLGENANGGYSNISIQESLVLFTSRSRWTPEEKMRLVWPWRTSHTILNYSFCLQSRVWLGITLKRVERKCQEK